MTAETRNLEFRNFLTNMAKTLNRVSLYPLNHPLVSESIQSSFRHLSNSLTQEGELTVSWTDDKVLLNGTPLTDLGTLQSILGGTFDKYQLHSLTFKSGVTAEEIYSFYKVFTTRADTIKDVEEVRSLFENEKIEHIQLDIAFFAKVSAKEKPSIEPISTSPGVASSVSEKENVSEMISNLEQKPLDLMLWEIVQKAVTNPEDQKKIYQIILKQLENDIKKHVENATRELEHEKVIIINENERTKSVVNHFAHGAIVVDDSGRIVSMNPTAEKIYGSSYSNLKGRHVGENAGEESMLALAKELATPLDKERAGEVGVQSAEETRFTIRNSMAMIQTPDGKIVGVMSILNDIAKQRELQRIQNDFMANVTHELRSPLTVIKASLGTISDDSGLDTQQKHIIQIANKNIDRLARLINDLLDCTKMESGQMSVNPKPIDSSSFLQEMVSNLKSWAQIKQIFIKLDLPQTLPQLLADYDRATQVVINLISNAIKFTPSRGTISVKAEVLNTPYLLISISDNGPGIPKDKLDHLFQRFHQLEQKEKSDTPGTGLGLYIAKTIVELHKGEIWVRSEEGKGTTFSFTLPTVPEIEVSTTIQEAAPIMKSWIARLFGR